jgi:hypothetical protein
LELLIATCFGAKIDSFTMLLYRREVRDLRKWLFGAVGSRVVPTNEFGRRCAGKMRFDLPGGWCLRLFYLAPPPQWTFKASRVLAEFLAPRSARRAAA